MTMCNNYMQQWHVFVMDDISRFPGDISCEGIRNEALKVAILKLVANGA
jgi:hypothetical protein